MIWETFLHKKPREETCSGECSGNNGSTYVVELDFKLIFREVVAKIVTHPPKHAVGSRIIRVFKSVEKPSNHKTYEEIDEMLDKVTKEQAKKALIDLKDPEEQMEALMRLLELQQDDLKTRTEIASHIQVST